MCLDGIMHLKPTAGCQISTLIFRFRGTLPTQALKTVKDPDNTFDLNPKWERTLPTFGNFSYDINRVPGL
jgi:hypothetical protein